ncbi:hypothetical protein [Gordonia hankookensis]|uniref:Uncharacterized protein n=1 Tax=Gordonia hankookensis TaxID=589403 RepID=A0ABR7W6T1_9ACTN|nr:hypothetical protein [Gordonia hankookensis]MBD1318529.1 hypothetical protein [Gordonia hankookensis]
MADHQRTFRNSRERAERAFQLRACGRSWLDVARALGYGSPGAAQTAVKRHLAREERLNSGDATLRELLEGARISNAVLYGRFSEALARRDDLTLVMLSREMRANRDQIAKLVGAYAPVQVQVEQGLTEHEFATEAARLLREISGAPPGWTSPVLDGEVTDVDTDEDPDDNADAVDDSPALDAVRR